jgi:hypothetical protein
MTYILRILSMALALASLPLQALSLSSSEGPQKMTTTRRQWLQNSVVCGTAAATAGILLGDAQPASAAPPISIIAEELGYFPVQNKEGTVMYIPKKVTRKSTDQAIELAKAMNEKGITMYGAYWCPHCSRQKELFGQEAWGYVNYVECAPKGYGFKGMCKNVDGYPTFLDKRGKEVFSGERPLELIAQDLGFKGFDASLEDAVPMIGTTCKLPARQ